MRKSHIVYMIEENDGQTSAGTTIKWTVTTASEEHVEHRFHKILDSVFLATDVAYKLINFCFEFNIDFCDMLLKMNQILKDS